MPVSPGEHVHGDVGQPFCRSLAVPGIQQLMMDFYRISRRPLHVRPADRPQRRPLSRFFACPPVHRGSRPRLPVFTVPLHSGSPRILHVGGLGRPRRWMHDTVTVPTAQGEGSASPADCPGQPPAPAVPRLRRPEPTLDVDGGSAAHIASAMSSATRFRPMERKAAARHPATVPPRPPSRRRRSRADDRARGRARCAHRPGSAGRTGQGTRSARQAG